MSRARTLARMEHTVEHDTEGQRFVLPTEDGTAHLSYSMRDAATMVAASTYTPPEARGKGLAGIVTRAALDHARAQGWKVVPSCWYVDGWITRNPAYEDLRA